MFFSPKRVAGLAAATLFAAGTGLAVLPDVAIAASHNDKRSVYTIDAAPGGWAEFNEGSSTGPGLLRVKDLEQDGFHVDAYLQGYYTSIQGWKTVKKLSVGGYKKTNDAFYNFTEGRAFRVRVCLDTSDEPADFCAYSKVGYA